MQENNALNAARSALGGDLAELIAHSWKLTPATCAHKITNGRWIPARHLLYLSTVIATELAKGNARIIVSMPPRHGKSEFLSINTPIWFLEKWPNKYVMNISYGLDLATDFSLRVRTTFLDVDLHQLLTTRLRKDKLKIDRFLTTAGGGVTAAGVGGVITGRGADLLLIDDYVKNAEAALSKSQRDSTWEWFKSTAYTRLEPNGSIIVLATRWDVDDLIGRLISEMPDENWVIINLPAIARENDPLGRAPGEALWPERYPIERLMKIKAALGSYWWEALFQQNPLDSMSDAQMGEKLQVVQRSQVPDASELKTLRIWDLSASEDKGDYTAGPLLSYHKRSGRYFIEDLQHFRKSPAKMETSIYETAVRDGLGITIWMEQEPGSAGKIVVDHYQDDVLPEFAFQYEKPTGKIEVRAVPLLAAIEAGVICMVEAPWNKQLKAELNAFPKGDHDDIISALALGYTKLQKFRKGGSTWGRKDVSSLRTRRSFNSEDASKDLHGKRRRRTTW